MNWQAIVDVSGMVVGLAGLFASVASYKQSERAAKEAKEAKESADLAAEHSKQAITVFRQELERGTVLTLITEASVMTHELEAHFLSKTYPSVLIRSKDVSKSLNYLVSRWGNTIPGSSSAAMADANAKIEHIRDRLQQLTNVTEKEHARLLGIIQPVVKSIDTELAQAQKRKEENGRKSQD